MSYTPDHPPPESLPEFQQWVERLPAAWQRRVLHEAGLAYYRARQSLYDHRNPGLERTTAPVARPIHMSEAMVQGLLDGRKKQTRRLVQPQPPPVEAVRKLSGSGYSWLRKVDRERQREFFTPAGPVWAVREAASPEFAAKWRCMPVCPLGATGDRLWVKETFTTGKLGDGSDTLYRADRRDPEQAARQRELMGTTGKWTPSIHMPRVQSRLLLQIRRVALAPLQSITDVEAIAEGILGEPGAWGFGGRHAEPRSAFAALWDGIYGAPGSLWADEPWVWVLDLEVLDGI